MARRKKNKSVKPKRPTLSQQRRGDGTVLNAEPDLSGMPIYRQPAGSNHRSSRRSPVPGTSQRKHRPNARKG